MTKSVEAIAGMYRQHGWEKQAKELEAVAERFKAEGVPEHFGSDGQDEEKQEPSHVLRRQWVAILAAEKVDSRRPKNETLFTSALAAKLNLVGQKFDDDTPLSVLAVNTKETYTQFGTPEQSISEREQRYEIDARIVRSYNRLINTLLRLDFETIGQVRSVHPRGFYKELQMRERSRGYSGLSDFNPDRLQFLQDALTRPLQTRPLVSER